MSKEKTVTIFDALTHVERVLASTRKYDEAKIVQATINELRRLNGEVAELTAQLNAEPEPKRRAAPKKAKVENASA